MATLKKNKNWTKTNYRLMQIKSIAECSVEHFGILLTFIHLPIVIKIFVLFIFEWPFYTGFTLYIKSSPSVQDRKSESDRETVSPISS